MYSKYLLVCECSVWCWQMHRKTAISLSFAFSCRFRSFLPLLEHCPSFGCVSLFDIKNFALHIHPDSLIAPEKCIRIFVKWIFHTGELYLWFFILSLSLFISLSPATQTHGNICTKGIFVCWSQIGKCIRGDYIWMDSSWKQWKCIRIGLNFRKSLGIIERGVSCDKHEF